VRQLAHANGHANGQSSPAQNGKSPSGSGPAGKGKTDWRIIWIAVDRIDPNPFQPRLTFDELEMQELVASVRAKGVQQPILVRTAKADRPSQNLVKAVKADLPKVNAPNGKVENGKTSITPANTASIKPRFPRYELVAGERRLRACKTAHKRWIPAIVRDDLSDAEAAELSLLENVQRSNISVIEEARGYKRLMLEFRFKEERLAKKVGKSVGTLREMMKLLQLPAAVQTLLFEKKLTASHGHALLPLAPFEEVCLAVAGYAAREKLTAVSLEGALLPNAKALKKQGLLVELDYKTKFDWQSTCGNCPFKAYVRSGYASYCLKPDEWEKKQLAALQQAEQEAQEAAQIMEQARQENGPVVEVEQLPIGSYKVLSFEEPPAGCSPGCPCYRETVDPDDPARKRPLCLDPNRYRGLAQAQREAEEHARRQRFNALWEAAKAKLLADVEKNDLRRLTVVLATPLLRTMYDQNGYVESWRQGVAEIAEELEALVLDEFLDAEEENEACNALDNALQQGLRPDKLLLLCALLMLAEEARTAIRFIRETPGLDFVLETRQQSLKEALPELDNPGMEGLNQTVEEDTISSEVVLA
jgi:ParB family chromosome partitioning protein